MVRIGTVKFQLRLERDIVGETAEETLLDGVARGLDEIVQELENVVVTCVGNGEILCKDLIQALVLALLGGSVKLQEVAERLQLDVEKVGVCQRTLDRAEVDSWFSCNRNFFGHRLNVLGVVGDALKEEIEL